MRTNEPDVTLPEGHWVVLAFHSLFSLFSLGLGSILILNPVGTANREFALELAPLWVWGACHLVVGLGIFIGMVLRSYTWIVSAFFLGACWYTFWGVMNMAPAWSLEDVPLAVGWQLLFIAVVHVLRMLTEIRRRASHSISISQERHVDQHIPAAPQHYDPNR